MGLSGATNVGPDKVCVAGISETDRRSIYREAPADIPVGGQAGGL